MAVNEMRLVLNVGGLSVLEIVVLSLFAVNVAWIMLPFVASLVGFVRVVVRGRRQPSEVALHTRTALLVPIHNEEPARVAAALEAMALELVGLGKGQHFDLFILSDTTDGDLALAEQEVVLALRGRLAGQMSVYYRRRLRNLAHKSGNVREFCERWGRAYDHLLMLDADSLLTGAAIVELVRRMEARPDVALIQTVPRLYGGTTLMARLQQFASDVYGPALGAGYAWWVATEGAYWGHNAILRARAFMESAGLPELPGHPPFGGSILSHDFVEAALLRRAGWGVSIADDLTGSYESPPPSIADMAVRDRRWCQGNFQHVRVLGARGLHWVSRLHFITGMLSYLSSPVWWLFIVIALAIGVQNELARPEYFSRYYTLFPLWPHMDPVRALHLFLVTLIILLGPKVMGGLAFLLRGPGLRWTDALLLPVNLLVEIVLSALVAPILMLIHCGVVMAVLRGRDSGWRPQRREGQALPWRDAFRLHRWHILMGGLLGAASLSISWKMLAWLAPAVVGMVFAIPLSQLMASAKVGRAFGRLGLLRVPEEVRPPAVIRHADDAYPHYQQCATSAPSLAAIVSDERLLRRHLALLDKPPEPSQSTDGVNAVAAAKIRQAESVVQVTASLTASERACVQSDPELLLALARLARLRT